MEHSNCLKLKEFFRKKFKTRPIEWHTFSELACCSELTYPRLILIPELSKALNLSSKIVAKKAKIA
jgi:hypothetical protein